MFLAYEKTNVLYFTPRPDNLKEVERYGGKKKA